MATLEMAMAENPGVALATVGKVGLDTNALIAVLEGKPADAAAVLQAIGNRIPRVSRTAVREFLAGGGSKDALRRFLGLRGGGVSTAAPRATVEQLEQAGLRHADAQVVGSARTEGTQVLTRDRRILNKNLPEAERF